jgi:hypothetical protein
MAFAKNESNPFSNWSTHINKPIYSVDGKRLGLLRKTSSDYMIISGGLINLSRYFVPKSMAESANKSTTYEARTDYSYAPRHGLLVPFLKADYLFVVLIFQHLIK